jgi:quinol monooxygenase YgiN
VNIRRKQWSPRILRDVPFNLQPKGATLMYTRIVEITSKSGKARELCNTIEEKVVPILKKQDGFVDETVLVSDAEENQVLGLSFWNNKENAERYHREQYPHVHEMLKHLLASDPVIRTFDVQSSTTHRITARKAA